MTQNNILVVRGGGDLASGVIHRLYRCGYRVLILESARPSAIRREVSFCEAVYDGEAFVEGVLSHRIQDMGECAGIWEMGEIPLLVDETGEAIKKLHPAAVIDAILAKKISAQTGQWRLLPLLWDLGFWPVEMWIMWWRLREAMILEGSWKRAGQLPIQGFRE